MDNSKSFKSRQSRKSLFADPIVAEMEKLDEEEKATLPVVELLIGFMQNAACNGIPNIERSGSWIRRIIWILLFLGGLGMTIWSIVEIFDKYYSYPVSININVTFASALPFPAVTFCNTNPIKKSRIGLASSELSSILPYTYGSNETQHLQTSKGRAQVRSEFQTAYSMLEDEVREQMGHQKDDMIVDCSYDGDHCSYENFTQFNNPYYGNCFTFSPDEGQVHRTGPGYGLALELYIDQDDYVGELTETAGVIVNIHAIGIMPFPENEGYLVSPDKATYFGISLINITRLKFPFASECWALSDSEAYVNSVYSEIYNTSYSTLACQKTCYQAHVVEACGCGDPLLPLEGDALIKVYNGTGDDIIACTTPAQIDCELAIRHEYKNDRLPCNCSVNCHEEVYTITQSSAIWPSDQFAPIYYQELASRYTHLAQILNQTDGQANIATNLIKLHIFYEEFNYEKIDESQGYTLSTMLADLGGAVGFYLGLSIIALFELLEFLLDLIMLGCMTCIKMGKAKKAGKTTKVETMS